jgi:hypothetical protein
MAGPPDQLERDDAVERLRAVAAEGRLSARSAQLRRLADDLAADSGLDRWAAIDLYAAFLRDDTVEDARPGTLRGRIGGVLDLLPAVLIFVPIMLTWIGLYKATSAYRHSRGDASLAGKSFLEQWQTGFNGRLGEGFYFDRIALWTLLAIGVLIVISLIQAMLRRTADRADTQERTRLTRELAGALTAADFQLSRFRTDDASRVDHAARRLEGAVEETRKASTAAEDLQRGAQEAMRLTRDGMKRVERLAEALQKSEVAVRSAVEQVADATEGVGRRLDDVSAATASVAVAAADLKKSTSADATRLRESMADAAAQLRGAAAADREQLADRISQALDTSATVIRSALDDWRTEGAIYSHRHETTADHFGVVLQSIERLMAQSELAAGRLPATVKDFEDHTRQSAQDLQRSLTAAVSAMRTELDRLLAGLPQADARTREVTTEFTELRRSVDLLRDQIAQAGGSRRRWFR